MYKINFSYNQMQNAVNFKHLNVVNGFYASPLITYSQWESYFLITFMIMFLCPSRNKSITTPNSKLGDIFAPYISMPNIFNKTFYTPWFWLLWTRYHTHFGGFQVQCNIRCFGRKSIPLEEGKDRERYYILYHPTSG